MNDERALALEHLGRMIKEGRYLDTGAHISSQVLKSLLIARDALGAQKEGKWVKEKTIAGNTYYKCSCCGGKSLSQRRGYYCKFCGAKMPPDETGWDVQRS